jgi:hypothetical protein
MGLSNARKAAATIGGVWQRTLLDALVAPGRFRRIMPEFRRTSDALFHPGIGDVKPFEIPAEGHVQMLDVDRGYGGMPPQDLYAVLRVSQWAKPTKIFEFGTCNGVTTAHLARNSQAEVYTLDLPSDMATDLAGYSKQDRNLLRPRDQIGSFYRCFNTEGRVRQLFGDSRTFDYRPYHGTMDLVIVDACHLYEYVLSDSQHAFDLLGNQGIILWHDFANSLDVTLAVRKLAVRYPIFHIEGTWLALHVRGERLRSQLECGIAGSDQR